MTDPVSGMRERENEMATAVWLDDGHGSVAHAFVEAGPRPRGQLMRSLCGKRPPELLSYLSATDKRHCFFCQRLGSGEHTNG